MEREGILKAVTVALLLASATFQGCSTEPGGGADASGGPADAGSAPPDASLVEADGSAAAADAGTAERDGGVAPAQDAGATSADAATGPGGDAQVADAAPQAGADSGLPDAALTAGRDAGAVAGDPSELPSITTASWEGTLANGKKVGALYPASWTGPMPLVVFAHGFQLGKGDYPDTLEHLARYGYVVASVDYPGSILGIDHHDVVVALQDAVDLLTTNPPAALAGRVDGTRVATMGHSVGGKGAVWAATEDARIKAVVALDPVDDDPSPTPDPAKHPSVTPEKMADLKVPALYFAADKSGTCAPAASNACRFDEASSASHPRYLAVLENFGHMQFVESSFCLLCSTCTAGASGAGLATVRASMRGMIVAFLEESLRGNAAWRGWLAGPERDALVAGDTILDPAAQTTFCAP